MLLEGVCVQIEIQQKCCLTVVFRPSTIWLPATGSTAEVQNPSAFTVTLFCCWTHVSPFGAWKATAVSVVQMCVSYRLHPWVLAVSYQKEKSIGWQAPLPGYLVSWSVFLCGKLAFIFFLLSFLVSQDIHRRSCLVPEKEPAPLLSTPPSQIKSQKYHKGDRILAWGQGW